MWQTRVLFISNVIATLNGRRTSLPPKLLSLAVFLLPAVSMPQGQERSVPAEDTAAAAVDPDWAVPRTSWGHPSFQGIWSVDDMRSIPRARPEHFGNRRQLTPDEFGERAAADDAARNEAVNGQSFAARREVGVRTFGFTSLVVDPPNGRFPELTEIGRERAAASSGGSFGQGPFEKFEDFTLYDRCITRGIFGSVLPSIYGNGIRITQSPDRFVITYEMIHETRVIPLDDRPQLSDDIRGYTGNGRGRFEGDTLVVETTNFTDRTSLGVGGAHSDQLKVTETYRRIDPQMIEYTATIDDPVTLTAPFTYRVVFSTMPNNYELYEYSCHEGNVAMSNMLKGARDYERRVAEAEAQGLPVPEPVPFRAWNDLGLPDDENAFIDINAGE